MKSVLLLLLLSAAATAREKLYTDSNGAHIGPQALVQLHKLRQAGVTELLVPTWFPLDLRNLRVKSAENEMGRFGPGLLMEWPAPDSRRSLFVQGGSGGFGGPGPDRTVPVENATLGTIPLWVNFQSPMSWRYCTDWLPIAGSMPTQPAEKRYHVLYGCNGRSDGVLSAEEMKQIIGSLRYYRIP